MKKAIEMQFHWIFVMIAGAIILGFFFTVVQKQRSYAEERISIRLSSDVEAVFSGAIESKGTIQFLPIPLGGISFYCSEVCECNFGIGKKVTGFRDKIMFAPDLLEDYEIVAWALEWKKPFRVANFLYMTNQNIKYYLVYDEDDPASNRLFKTINKALPEDLNLLVISPSEVENILPEGWHETKLVFLEVDPYGYTGLLDDEWSKESLSIIQLSPPQIVFFEKEEKTLDFTSRSSLLSGEPTYYAALFASDKTMYDCGMQAAFTRLANVGKVLHERTIALDAGSDRCIYFPEQVEDVVNAAKAAVLGIASGDTFPITQLNSAVETLELQNRNMVKESCPEIF